MTHLFVGEEEYRANKNYLEMTDSKMRIVVVAGKNIILPQEKRIEIIRKPLCTQSVLNILKEKESDLSKRKKRKMICPDGRVLGKMAHSERRGDGVAVNIYGDQDQKIFKSGVKYFA